MAALQLFLLSRLAIWVIAAAAVLLFHPWTGRGPWDKPRLHDLGPDWLINLSELPEILGKKPVRSELVWLLVRLDKEYTTAKASERWEDVYARELLATFAP